jgi:NAD+ kinase
MTFGIFGNISKPVIKEVSENLLRYLRKHSLPYVVQEGLGTWLTQSGTTMIAHNQMCSELDLPKRCDVLIALGGDGTMLAAARMIADRNVPILGVNLGKLGFLAEVSIDEMNDCIEDIVANRTMIEERMVLQAQCSHSKDQKTYFALNEIVVDRGLSARVIDLETYVNGDYVVTYAADGIIVNTPTGSTAYSLASGGPIIVPQSKVMTINPISPHSLTARPIVVPEECTVRIVVKNAVKPVHLTADGQVEGFYEHPAEIIIKKAPYTTKLIKRHKRTYYELLRTKLMWGKDLRIENPK